MHKLLLYLLLLLVLVGCTKPNRQVPFDSAKWKKGPSHIFHDRPKMLNDLQKNHLRLGMKKDDVEFILGKPDRILAKHEVSGGGKDILLYWHYQLPVDNGSYDSTVFCVGFNNHNSIVYMKTLQN